MANEGIEVKFNELCRVCLTKTYNMRELLNSSGEVSDLIGKLSSIIKAEINVAVNKTHPNFICLECEEKLNLSYDFQQMSLKSHKTILDLNKTVIDIDVKPSYIDFITYTPEKVKEEGPIEEISIVYENYDNGKDDNSSDEDSVEDQKSNKISQNKTVQYKSTKKVFICNEDEVANYIKEVKKKFYATRNCLFCGFTSSNVRTLSVHMSRLHGSYKDKWCWKCNKMEHDLPGHVESHKDDFKCPFCGKQSTTSSHFVEHLSRHTVNQKHVCQICQYNFISTGHLRLHYKKVHNKKILSCEVCSENFIEKKILLDHLKIHKTIKCKTCEERFFKEKYDSHKCFKIESLLQDFKENSEYKKEDDIENTNAENVSKSNEENTAAKSDIKPHRYCEICKRKVRNLMNHVNKHHNKDCKKDEPKALCTYCGKQFKHLSNLDVHMRTHTKVTPYKCSYCEVSVATRTRLVDHERTHTGEKPFVCKFCGKAFKQHGVLNTHLKLHTGRTEQCLLCPKRFCRPSELRNHMRVHTGEKPFACSYCEKCFIQRSHLVEHIKIHTDHRPFKCHICGKAFKQSSTLKGHLNVHEGKKMFKCTVCSYSCRKSYTLKQHLLQHQNTNMEQTFQCDICEGNFLSLELLATHKNTQHQSLEMPVNITVDLKFTDTCL